MDSGWLIVGDGGGHQWWLADGGLWLVLVKRVLGRCWSWVFDGWWVLECEWWMASGGSFSG